MKHNIKPAAPRSQTFQVGMKNHLLKLLDKQIRELEYNRTPDALKELQSEIETATEYRKALKELKPHFLLGR